MNEDQIRRVKQLLVDLYFLKVNIANFYSDEFQKMFKLLCEQGFKLYEEIILEGRK